MTYNPLEEARHWGICLFIYLYVDSCTACICLCTTYLQCPWRPEEGTEFPEIRVTDNQICEQPWMLETESSRKQSAFLSADPSLQPPFLFLFYFTFC